jgi:hypothetical protein
MQLTWQANFWNLDVCDLDLNLSNTRPVETILTLFGTELFSFRSHE